MPKRDDEVWVQLATRIPKPLHRQLKLHCVQSDSSVMGFVVSAIEEKLSKSGERKRRSG
jgi:predicted HicB family RNase H-like nuclease